MVRFVEGTHEGTVGLAMELPLHLDRSGSRPLHAQIYGQIRHGIESGHLPVRTRLPSVRELATRLGVARNTVAVVYEQLVAEGYLEARVGAWTAVASSPPGLDDADRVAPPEDRGASTRQYRTSRRMELLPETLEFPQNPKKPVKYDFRFPVAAVPTDGWQRVLARHWAAFESHMLVSRVSEGDRRLRSQIARYLGAARAVVCTPDQIVITNSDQQALSIVAHLTADVNDEILMEDPGNRGCRLAFEAFGARVVPVPVDGDGVDPIAVARSWSDRARLLYVTPSHQFPMGTTLSRARRVELVRWAAAAEALIVEDDRDSGYRYGGPTLESLQGLDPEGVIYLGSLKEVVGGTVGVGYLVLPPGLVGPVRALQRIIDTGPPPFVQSALAEFMASGLFARHLRRMQRQHRLRRDALREALDRSFGEQVVIGPALAGTFLHVRWVQHPATAAMIQAALRAQVGLRAVAPYYARPPGDDPGVMMFYGSLSEDSIAEGVQRLARVLSAVEAQPA